jgi:hypothetical protein
MDRSLETRTSDRRPWSVLRVACRGFVVSGAALVSGCITRGDVEMLEANLRQQQDIAAGYQSQLGEVREELQIARDEVDQLRSQLAAAGTATPQEVTEPLARVVGVQFNAMMTGGRDDDGKAGPETLTAVLSPHDQDGDLVKLSGDLEVELLDLARSGEEQRIGHWSFTARESRDLWHSGFIASGYQFDLPLKTTPRSGEAVLHGRLTTSDGRQFDTSMPVNLVTATVASTPKGLKPVKNAKPLASGGNASKARLGGGGLHVVDGPAPEEDALREASVQPAGFVSLEDEPEASAGAPATRPVPNPPDDELTWPTETPGDDVPRPFPGKSAEKAKSATAKPMPSGTRTSDNWTDATIPRLQ